MRYFDVKQELKSTIMISIHLRLCNDLFGALVTLTFGFLNYRLIVARLKGLSGNVE